MSKNFKLEDSKIWCELKHLERTAGPDGLIDLTRLWHAAGRPKGRSPRQRYPKDCRRYKDFGRILRHDGRSADAPAWATVNTAYDYCQYLDPRIMMAMNDFFWAQMERDPVGSLMEAPDPAKAMVGLFVKHIVATQSGGSREDAARKIVSDVVKRTSGLDDLQQETEVAKAQRAVRGERPIHGRGDGETVEEGLA